MTAETHIIRFGETVRGSVYNLSRYAHIRDARLKAGTYARVWLGDEWVGEVCRERRKNKGRGCWRWVGYEVVNGIRHELADTASTDKMATARAVATVFLQKRSAAFEKLTRTVEVEP